MPEMELKVPLPLEKILALSERVFWFVLDSDGRFCEYSANFQRIFGEFDDIRGRLVGEVFLTSAASKKSLSIDDFKIGQEFLPVLVRQALTGRPCRIVASNMTRSILCWGEIIGDHSTTGLNELSAITSQMQNLLLETHRQKKLIEKDLEAAAWLQQRLLPKSNLFTRVEAAWEFRPCAQIGGDLFGIFNLPGSDIGVHFIDVSGHGVPSAMMAVAVSQVLQQFAISFANEKDRRTKMGKLLEKLESDFPIERFNLYFTMIYFEFCPENNQIFLVNAGHPAPILQRSNEIPFELDQGGPFIGMDNSELVPVQEFSVEPGDRLFIYSDGLTERRNGQGDFYDKNRLLKALQHDSGRSLRELVGNLVEKNDTFAENKSAEDDLTLLGIEILP
jgi:sigma-B regulation protein RsbU (phosphoserine phosphatase)